MPISTIQFTRTAEKLAEEQCSLGRYYLNFVTIQGSDPLVELITKCNNKIVIYTYLDGPQEFLSFTTYLKGDKFPSGTGGCSIKEARKLLSGLGRYYSEN